MKASWRSSLVGAQKSSESRNAISGARAISTPRFRAAAGPRCSMRSIRVVPSRRARCSTVPSVEPSSMTINSNCAERLREHGINRLAHHRAPIVRRNDYRDFGSHHASRVSRRRRDRRRGFGGAGRRVPRRRLRRQKIGAECIESKRLSAAARSERRSLSHLVATGMTSMPLSTASVARSSSSLLRTAAAIDQNRDGGEIARPWMYSSIIAAILAASS